MTPQPRLQKGWKLADFHLFRPLVYFAAFGVGDIFVMLDVAIQSLLSAGKWRWDIAVLTEPGRVASLQAQLAEHGYGGRLHVVPVSPCVDLVDWCMSRFRALSYPLFAAYQPILYLDVDVICDRPLEPLLTILTHTRLVHFCREGRLDEGTSPENCHWFGYPLLAADQIPANPLSTGFSAGIMGFANRGVVSRGFDLIPRSAMGYAAEICKHPPFAGTDQSFAGYVLRKLGLADLSTLHQAATLFRINPQAPQIPDPVQARGLVHFFGVPYPLRIALMKAYLEAVLRRDAGPMTPS